MSQNRYYSSIFPPTTLASAILSNSATSISINSITGEPASFPYTLLVDWGLSTQEAMSVTATSGTGPYTCTVVRGIDGTEAQTHVNGAIVVHGVSAEDYNEPQVHIASGTSGASYPNVIHGLQSGSSVVGTTDTQTLTNKTLGATAFTGAAAISESATGGEVLSVTNTHSSPTNANVNFTSASASDLELAVNVSGDTDNRFQMNASGKAQWGPGGASAVDTDLYRASAGTLQTDGNLTVSGTVTAGTEAISGGSSTGELFQVTNTTSAPSNPTGVFWGAAATDGALGFRVTGDAHSRLDIRANGQLEYGSGSAAGDTDLYRNASGELKTDTSFTAAGNLTVAGAQLLAGGSGVIGVNNAATTPTSTPSGGAVQYAKSGYMKWRGTDGNDYQMGSQFALGSAITGTTGTSAQSITGLSASLGAGTYAVSVNLVYTPQATIGSTNTFQFAFSGTSTSANLTGVCNELSTSTSANVTTVTSAFTTPTHTSGSGTLQIWGTITVSVAGTLQLQFTNTLTSDLVNILNGSLMEIQPIA